MTNETNRANGRPVGQPVGWFNDQPISHPSEKPVDMEDPFDASLMRVPFDDPEEGLLLAARCYVEEYITMGYTDSMLFQMFRKPFYMGLHPVYKIKGAEFVSKFIEESRRELAQSGVYPRRRSTPRRGE